MNTVEKARKDLTAAEHRLAEAQRALEQAHDARRRGSSTDTAQALLERAEACTTASERVAAAKREVEAAASVLRREEESERHQVAADAERERLAELGAVKALMVQRLALLDQADALLTRASAAWSEYAAQYVHYETPSPWPVEPPPDRPRTLAHIDATVRREEISRRQSESIAAQWRAAQAERAAKHEGDHHL